MNRGAGRGTKKEKEKEGGTPALKRGKKTPPLASKRGQSHCFWKRRNSNVLGGEGREKKSVLTKEESLHSLRKKRKKGSASISLKKKTGGGDVTHYKEKRAVFGGGGEKSSPLPGEKGKETFHAESECEWKSKRKGSTLSTKRGGRGVAFEPGRDGRAGAKGKRKPVSQGKEPLNGRKEPSADRGGKKKEGEKGSS